MWLTIISPALSKRPMTKNDTTKEILLELQTLKQELKQLRENIGELKQDTRVMVDHVDFIHLLYERARNPVNKFLSTIYSISQWITTDESLEFLEPMNNSTIEVMEPD